MSLVQCGMTIESHRVDLWDEKIGFHAAHIARVVLGSICNLLNNCAALFVSSWWTRPAEVDVWIRYWAMGLWSQFASTNRLKKMAITATTETHHPSFSIHPAASSHHRELAFGWVFDLPPSLDQATVTVGKQRWPRSMPTSLLSIVNRTHILCWRSNRQSFPNWPFLCGLNHQSIWIVYDLALITVQMMDFPVPLRGFSLKPPWFRPGSSSWQWWALPGWLGSCCTMKHGRLENANHWWMISPSYGWLFEAACWSWIFECHVWLHWGCFCS